MTKNHYASFLGYICIHAPMVMSIRVVLLRCNTYGNLNDNTLEEVFNSDLMKKIRVDMMNNVKSESCERCWKQEENGGTQ